MVNLFHHFVCFLAAVVISISIASAQVAATLDRDSVEAGEGALLEITISGSSVAKPEIPAIGNLIVQPRGQQQRVEIMNGNTSVSTTYRYAVGSQVPGDYEIPPIEVMLGGNKFSTQLLKLKVLAAGAASPPQNNQGNQANPQTPQEETSDENRFGFLTVELANTERKHAYVGEIAPVRIRAWLPGDSRANLRSGIQPEGKGFTLHNLSNRPQQSQESKDGKRYVVVTWFGGISATKAGTYPASLSVNLTVAVPDTSAPKLRRPKGGPFDDPFLNDVLDQMNRPMIQKDLTLRSIDQEIEVRPLPTEGRPEGFTGAVGDFKFDGAQIPNQWQSGEPQQILAKISGTGNFALMKSPMLTPKDAWKSYDGKDEFQAGDQASFSGSKTFQFSAVPRKGGEQQVALEFSFFDPATAAYKTINTQPQNIQVSGEDIFEPKSVAATEAKQPDKKRDEMIAQRTELSPVRSLVPLKSRPAFWQILSISAGLCILGGLLALGQRYLTDPKRRASAELESATRAALETAGKCAESKDVSGYFAAARLAIQQRLGAMWNQPPQAITLAEVSARIPGDSPVIRFFREADLYVYSRHATGEVLPQWRSLLDEAMASIKPSTH